MRKLFTFHGGIHPPQHKALSTHVPITRAPLPSLLVVPLRQHIGAAAKLRVRPGDPILKGQRIGDADNAVSAAVHAPTSGRVVAVEPRPVAHPSGLPDTCVMIAPDGEERWIAHAPLDYSALPPSMVLDHLRDNGVVGLGGAVFPTHIKLNPGGGAIHTLVINGAECEPWITSDDMLMRERAAGIVRGIHIIRHLLEPTETVIGIEDNKPEAIAAMQAACDGHPIEVAAIPTLYPTGGEKQLIKVLTGKEVPSGGRAYQIGVICMNVATAYTIYRAIDHGEPVISRIVTITGNVQSPQNAEVLLGTPLKDLIALAGGALPGTQRYLMGGPMMGLELSATEIPVVKASNCFIAVSARHFPPPPPALPCIRCTRCASVCPVDLRPYELYWFARGNNFGKAQEYSLFDCIECGGCDYVCPSHIPLVQYYRFAKSEIWAQEKDKRAADKARQHHEFRQFRLEREKTEKAKKHAKATAGASSGDDKKAAIQAAVARAQAKKSAITPKNTDNLPPQAQEAIAAIDARRGQPRDASISPLSGADREEDTMKPAATHQETGEER